ncbi:MAG: hypothetical protein RLZZ324_884 [Candidatus Parcubacteria bacterium]|jgi:hypothetical protein
MNKLISSLVCALIVSACGADTQGNPGDETSAPYDAEPTAAQKAYKPDAPVANPTTDACASNATFVPYDCRPFAKDLIDLIEVTSPQSTCVAVTSISAVKVKLDYTIIAADTKTVMRTGETDLNYEHAGLNCLLGSGNFQVIVTVSNAKGEKLLPYLFDLTVK